MSDNGSPQPTPVGPKPVIFITPGPSTWPLIAPLRAAGFAVAMPGRNEARQFGETPGPDGQPIPNVGALEDLLSEPLQTDAVSGATILAAQAIGKLGTGEMAQAIAGPLETLTHHADVVRGDGARSNGHEPQTPHEAVLPHLTRWLPAWLHQSLARQMVWLKALEAMCQLRDVRAFVVHNDVEEMTKCFCLFAAAHGIPAVHVPHAVYLDWGHGPLLHDVHDVVSADWVCVAGWFQAEWYKARGARKVAVTGLPQWDGHAKSAAERDRVTACRRLKLDEKRPVVVYYSSWAQQTAAAGFHNGIEVAYRAMLKLAKAAKEAGTWQLVVKTHPHARVENAQWHGQQAAEAGVSCIVADQYLDLCLQVADVCVAYGTSATVMESAVYGTPLVSIAGFADDEAVLTTGDAAESIGPAIEQALSPAWQQRYAELRPRFVEKYAGRVDGQATARVVEHVARLTGRGKA